MELLHWILSIDEQLIAWARDYGPWIYSILFVIIFCETGLVIAPFLPGDSLLFAAGALAALDPPPIHIVYLLPLLIVAAVLGDAVNYAIGRFVGPKIFRSEQEDTGDAPAARWRRWLRKLLNRDHLESARKFYDRHGAKTIVLARFVPIVRTFAPFVAGIGHMRYGYFWSYNVIGAICWVLVCSLCGYAFGNIEVVKRNFELVIIGIIAVSVLPIAFEYWRSRRAAAVNHP